jgi:hypothetical protein
LKKKLVIISTGIFTLLLAWLFFGPPHFDAAQQLTIGLPIDQVSPQITDTRNWSHWFGDLKNIDSSCFYCNGSRYTILNQRPARIVVKEESDEGKIYHFFSVSSDSFGRATRISWVKAYTPFYWIKYKLDPSSRKDSALHSLKTYLEDPLRYYGFRMYILPVTDTLVITKKAITSINDRIKTLSRLYNNLREYASSNDILLDENQPRMAYFKPVGKDSILIWAGLPSDKKTLPGNGVESLALPKKGRMLVGLYEGPYDGLEKLYSSMDKYVRDRNFSRVPAQFEKYLTNPASAADSLHMKIEVHYAIL